MTFHEPDRNPKWSYVQTTDGLPDSPVVRIAEKDPISDIATCGVYVARKSNELFDAIRLMILWNERVNNEFYIAPAFNHLLPQSKNFSLGIFPYSVKMIGLGTPEDYEKYYFSS